MASDGALGEIKLFLDLFPNYSKPLFRAGLLGLAKAQPPPATDASDLREFRLPLVFVRRGALRRADLMGDKFSVADAYLFTVLRWTSRIDIDLAKWPNLKAYVDRLAARPKVQGAEGGRSDLIELPWHPRRTVNCI